MAKQARTVQITAGGTTQAMHHRTDGATGTAADIPGAVLMRDGSDSAMQGQQTAANSLPVTIASDQPNMAAGWTPYSALSTAAVLASNIRNSAGRAGFIHAFNISASPVYVRLYDQSTSPASGDTANIKWRGVIPGTTTGDGVVIPIDDGLVFASGIGIRVTAAIADNDNTALSANTVLVNVGTRA